MHGAENKIMTYFESFLGCDCNILCTHWGALNYSITHLNVTSVILLHTFIFIIINKVAQHKLNYVGQRSSFKSLGA